MLAMHVCVARLVAGVSVFRQFYKVCVAAS
jgi:hypothetical protein